MPQSLSKVYLHCVFSTKKCELFISDDIQKDLHSYIIGVLLNNGSYVYEIYANPDHIHILCVLPRTITIAELISKIKTSSSKWIKKKGISGFSWQNGYGTFSVSSSKVELVKSIFKNKKSITKELLLKKNIDSFLRNIKLIMTSNMFGISSIFDIA